MNFQSSKHSIPIHATRILLNATLEAKDASTLIDCFEELVAVLGDVIVTLLPTFFAPSMRHVWWHKKERGRIRCIYLILKVKGIF